MASGLATKNKLHVSWSDTSFLQYLNPVTVLDYFCDPRNPFYDSSCNNQILKMQGQGPEKLSSMEGIEYQLYLCQHPLYLIRKVHRSREFVSPGVLKATPITYYYILHGNVYQAPDVMSVVSARLQMASYYLEECLETAFSHYVFNPSRGYYWDFNQNEESNKKEMYQQKSTGLHIERIDSLLHEFANKFPPHKFPEEPIIRPELDTKDESKNLMDTQSVDNKNSDQPVEKKMKMNIS